MVEECEKFEFTKLEDNVHFIMPIEKGVPTAKYLLLNPVLIHLFENSQIIFQDTKMGNSGTKNH